MQLQSLLVFLSSAAAITAATPLRRRCSGTGTTPPPTPSSGVTYVLPSTGGPTSLPSPDAPLKHILVGHGVQNYTCATAGVTAASAGALAVLHDITALYPGSGPSALSSTSWDELTGTVLRTTSQPIVAADPASPFPAPEALSVSGVASPIPFIGHHFFDISSVPTFDLITGELFKGQKLLNIPAPASADRGLTDEGAVDWLYLGDKGTSVGLAKVYRVLTSGGSPAVCGAVGETQSVPYTAMYWLY
ncbi:hypothetical protein F5B18DRAFT_362282 [Nemania serpens]|nr:hypothetical protein F5B18DRAFT_362282 [Nemania serpens]